MNIRPFFGFYGGKWRDTPKHYPPPIYKTIIEPFAGSAGYSLRYPNKSVILYELDPIISSIWEYLISVSEQEIRSIPDVEIDGSVDDLKISQEAAWLVGFWLNRGASRPRKKPSSWMKSGIRPGSFWGERVRNTIANQLQYIRHWKIKNCSYLDCLEHKSSTWFIDPPYENAGVHYKYGSDYLDFEQLGVWCQNKTGQVIVCESGDATWLPFKKLNEIKTTRKGKRSTEAVWTNRWQDFEQEPELDFT